MTYPDTSLMTTREEFTEAYAHRSGVTMDWLRANGREVRPCVDCDFEGCEGWQMAYIGCDCQSCKAGRDVDSGD